MIKTLLEICADSVESALNAKNGGADRLELCGNLVIGGTTPGEALFREIRRLCDIRIHVLIRPRFGDFLYTEHEFEIIRQEVKQFKNLGAEGVVIGCLKADGALDMDRMGILMEEAKGMKVTLHRAFDVCRNPIDALEQAADLGISTILTSGQEKDCVSGLDLIRHLVQISAGRVDIMAGAGVSQFNLERIYRESGVTSFHMSGKQVLQSGMEYRKSGVPMGLEGLSEFEVFRTDRAAVEEARAVLRKLR